MEISDQELVALGRILSSMPGLMAMLRQFTAKEDGSWTWTGRPTTRSRLFSEILERRRSLGCWDPEFTVETEAIPSMPWYWERGGRRI